MDEIDVIRRFRADVPRPDAATVAAAYQRARPQQTIARPKRNLVLAVSLLGAAVVATGALTAVVKLGFSDGTPVAPSELTSRDRYVLGRLLPANASVLRIATRNGRTFHVLRHGEALCFASGPADGDPRLASATCPGTETPRFPSAGRPLLDRSVFEATRRNQQAPFVTRLEGFAADAVREVAIVTVDGARHTTPVLANVYSWAEVPKVPVRELQALGADGHALYTMCVQRGGCP
jgi:hypothetical protein